MNYNFEILSNIQLDNINTINTILEGIISNNFLNIFIYTSVIISIIIPIYFGSFRAAGKRIWDGTKWVLVTGTAGVISSAGQDIYKDIKDKVKNTGNSGNQGNSGSQGNQGNSGNSGNQGNSGNSGNQGNSGSK